MRPFKGIKPQDIVILLKLALLGDKPWRHVDLAEALGLSQPEISFALDRCKTAGFIDSSKKTVMRAALLEFISHGIRYVFPARPGPLARGIPTAHSAPPLYKSIVAADDDIYVWPWDDGKVRGQAIEPLYPNIPWVAENDLELYELLALVDAIRVGRAREKVIATQELTARLAAGTDK